MTGIRSIFIFAVFSGLMLNSMWGLGHRETTPTIEMADQKRQFIAPSQERAKSKILTIPFSSLAFSEKGQSIKSWTFSVFDTYGTLVFQDSKIETKDRGFFKELFNIGAHPQVEIPKDLFWDGTYRSPDNKDNGKVVPDGDYTWLITVTDSAGGKTQTPPFRVTVNNSNVTIDYIRTQNTVFSPAGQRSSLAFEQSGSPESHWEGIFTDKSGNPVRTYVWDNPTDNQAADVPPLNFSWDGKDGKGNILPEGEYFYTLEGRNRTGVSARQQYSFPLIISMKTGLLSISSDVPVFSPRAEGAPNAITFMPISEEKMGLQKWRLAVYSAAERRTVYWSTEGTLPLPESIVFDGKNSLGQTLREGRYEAVLSADFENGNSVESQALPFELDLTPPKAELRSSAMVFGGTGRPDVTVSLEGTAGIVWTLQILDAEGTVRAGTAGDETGWAQLAFGGTDADGQPLPDGKYTVLAMAHGKSGIPGSSALVIQKDSRPMNAKVELSAPVLIPGTGERNKVRITPVLDVIDSIVQTNIHIIDSEGAQIATRSSAGIVTFWDWNGLSSDKASFPDGTYEVTLETTYANGTVANAKNELTLDSTYLLDKGPHVEMSLSGKSFIPGNMDGPSSLTVSIKTTEGVVPVQGWNLSINDPNGNVFRRFAGNGIPPEKILWDGKADNGEVIESGDTYQLILSVSDIQQRETTRKESVNADILVERLADGRLKIVITSIHYPGYSSDIFKASPDLLETNMFVLRRLSAILNTFPDYKIRLEGYAVSILWENARDALAEQQTELLPLSLDRALEVKAALVLLGVDESRFTVEGFGSDNPVVPNSDLANRWKNRRVEFYLDRK